MTDGDDDVGSGSGAGAGSGDGSGGGGDGGPSGGGSGSGSSAAGDTPSAAGAAAQQAYDYAQSVISYSTNKLYSYVLNIVLFGQLNANILQFRSQAECSAFTDSQITYSNEQFFQAVVNFATTQHIGNCGEYACVIANQLRNSGTPMDVHIMKYADGDHNWVVANLGQGADPNNPSTWQDDAWVIDGWKSDIFQYNAGAWQDSYGDHRCVCDTSW